MLKNKAFFFDRDGVLNCSIVKNGRPYSPNKMNEFVIDPFAKKIINYLKAKNFKIIVVTNQPDVGRGKQKRETVEEIHSFLKKQLPLDDIYVCWHGQDGECDCRKPLPGMLFQAAEKYGIDLSQSFLVGDRWKDIEAGKLGGCKTVFIDCGYNEILRNEPDFQTNSIRTTIQWILNTLHSSV